MGSSRTVARQCQLCEAHCGILVHVEEDSVTRIEGDPEDVLSRGYICPKATALADVHRDPDRLRRPMRRVGDGFEECSWDEAFDLIGQNLRRIQRLHGRDAIGMYFGNPSAHSPAAMYIEVLRRVLRTKNVYSASSVDQFPQYIAYQAMYGDHVCFPVADVDRTDHLLVLGANPAVSNGSITTMPDAKGRIRAIRKRGGTVVVVDPRRTETARIADSHVAIRPGGDPYLLAGMLHTLFDDGLDRPPHLAGRLAGWDELVELVAPWTPERAAEVCGVEADTIRAMARAFAEADSAVAYARIGVCHHTTGSVTHWLVNALNAVTGNLDRAGGSMFTTPPVDIPWVLRMVAGPSGRDRWRSRVRDLPELGGELPVAGLADEILTPGPGQVRAMIVHAGNPCLSTPDAARLDHAFQQLDFQVSIDLYVTETSRHADVILPPTSHLERSEFDVLFPYLSVRNNARYSPAVFDPARGARHDWQLLLGIATELLPRPHGRSLPLVNRLPVVPSLVDAVSDRAPWVLRLLASGASPDRVSAALIAVGPQGPTRRGVKGLTLRKVKKARGGVDLGPLEAHRLSLRLRTDDGRVQLAPPLLVDEARRVFDGHLNGGEPGGEIGMGRHATDFDLQLIGRRHLRSNNSWLHNVETMVKGRDRCTALMHPQDAVDRELLDGQTVRVTSPIGAIEVPLEVSDEIRRGVVAIPHGWGHDVKGVGWSTAAAHAGANVNRLTDASLLDRLSGNGALNATWVRVAAVDAASEVAPVVSG